MSTAAGWKSPPEGSNRSFRLKTDYNPFEMTADTVVASLSGFCRIRDYRPEHQYDDYEGVDVGAKSC
ncbi:MAG: hypothetical protein MZV63_58240 [Marinilabiliales bacterium]|nr:hypothetical protein [Marinilabiliales bacterium]